ncbi:MAG: hypothetical protein PF961_14025 [Planctomycetota bacterium]|jgi:hypothetical protein|nr:hypothetical protein [Planctomycetota bacterium]
MPAISNQQTPAAIRSRAVDAIRQHGARALISNPATNVEHLAAAIQCLSAEHGKLTAYLEQTGHWCSKLTGDWHADTCRGTVLVDNTRLCTLQELYVYDEADVDDVVIALAEENLDETWRSYRPRPSVTATLITDPYQIVWYAIARAAHSAADGYALQAYLDTLRENNCELPLWATR